MGVPFHEDAAQSSGPGFYDGVPVRTTLIVTTTVMKGTGQSLVLVSFYLLARLQHSNEHIYARRG